MPLFTSPRERFLWWCWLLVVVAIFATLGLAQTLATVLRNQGLLALSFMLAMALIATCVTILGLSVRPGAAVIGVALGIAGVYLLVFVRMASIEERTHIIEYGLVGALLLEALRERRQQGRAVPLPALLAACCAAVLGVLDESVQALLPNRVFDPRDILFNILAGSMAVSSIEILRWANRRFGKAGRTVSG